MHGCLAIGLCHRLHCRTADSSPDNRFPSGESVSRTVWIPNQVKLYVPPTQTTVALLPSLCVVVLLLECTVTLTPLCQSQVPMIRLQGPPVGAVATEWSADRRGLFVGTACRESAVSSPPEIDFSCFPIVPPVEPACAKALSCWASAKSPNSSAKPTSRPLRRFIGNLSSVQSFIDV
jgi:hypothetical protein